MARKIGVSEVHAALYTLIDTLSYDVYDHVPEQKVYPYIVIADAFSGDEGDDKSNFGRSVTQRINIWSDYRGKKECEDIADAIAALVDTSLTVTGFQVIHVTHSADFSRENESVYRGMVDIELFLKQS
jgi:hypothetical protein